MNTLYTAVLYNDRSMIRKILKERKRTLDPTTIQAAKDTCVFMKRTHLLDAFDI